MLMVMVVIGPPPLLSAATKCFYDNVMRAGFQGGCPLPDAWQAFVFMIHIKAGRQLGTGARVKGEGVWRGESMINEW
eukprot:4218971-Karenia_brevis.AAC.1